MDALFWSTVLDSAIAIKQPFEITERWSEVRWGSWGMITHLVEQFFFNSTAI